MDFCEYFRMAGNFFKLLISLVGETLRLPNRFGPPPHVESMATALFESFYHKGNSFHLSCFSCSVYDETGTRYCPQSKNI